MKSQKIAGSKCPGCSALLDGVTSFEGKTPTRGDITICIYCGQVCCFCDDMGLRIASKNDLKGEHREKVLFMRKKIIDRIKKNDYKH